MVIYEVYKRALIRRGSAVEFLYSEVANPFDGQALGWGIDTEWVTRFDAEGNETASDGSVANETTNASADNGTGGNESGQGIDMDRVTLWSNIMNTKVYEDDVEAVGNETDANGTANATDDGLENESD